MRLQRTFVLGIAACILAGILIGASQATVTGPTDDSPMTVPTSRVGDRVTYASFSEGDHGPVHTHTMEVSTSAGGGHQVSGGTATAVARGFVGASTFQVVGTERAMDRTGAMHDVVVFSRNQHLRSEAGMDQADHTEHEKVDLDSRKRIQLEAATSLEGDATWTLLFRDYQIQDAQVPGLAYQGRTLALGDDLSHDLVPIEADPEESGSRLLQSSQRRWVADRALIDGRDSYEIRTLAEMRVHLDGEAHAQMTALFGRSVPAVILFRSQETVWLSSELPYPVLMQRRIEADLGEREPFVIEHGYETLQEHKEGSGATIRWGADGTFRDINPDLERSGTGAAHPADGAGSRLAYPLSAALRDVRQDLRLVQFQAWRQANPNHHLVSADLLRGEHSTQQAETSMWRLVFAVPNGAAYMVSAERVHPSLPPYVEDRGALRVPAYSVNDLPVRPVTIAAVERLWQDQASDRFQSLVPNYVHWGYHTNQTSGAACVATMTRTVSTTSEAFRTIELGHTSWGSCVEPDNAARESLLLVDLASGNLLAYHESQFDWKRQPLGTFSTEARGFDRHPKTAGFAPRAPDVQQAAAASSSLLAVFLALYFLPALKFAGAKALLLVPGYAKLRREELLDNKIRDQILQVVRNDPGISTTELSKRVDAGWGTVVYHLSVLEKNKLISSLIDGRYHRFFPVGVFDFSARGQMAALKNERTRQIYESIAHEPGILQDHLARRVGISAPAAIFHLKRLEEVGMVGRVKKRGRVHYYANEQPRPGQPSTETGVEFQ